MKEISVIVPVRNRERYIGPCLESILDQAIGEDRFEVIVVDNGSTDKTAQVIRSYPVKYLYLERPSISASRNLGIRNSSGEYVAFIDSDSVADENWLRELLGGFDHPRVGGCGGKISVLDKDNKRLSTPLTPHERFIECNRSNLPRAFTGNVIFKRRSLSRVGFFDETAQLELNGEDVDLSWRLHLAGYHLKYVDSAIVYHDSKLTIKDVCRIGYRKGQTNGFMKKKYYFINKMFCTGINMVLYPQILFLLYVGKGATADNIFLTVVKGLLYAVSALFGEISFIAGYRSEKYRPVFKRFKEEMMDMTAERGFSAVEDLDGSKMKIPKGVIWGGRLNETNVADMTSRNVFHLNKIGSFIWCNMLDSRPLDEITVKLAESYGMEYSLIEKDVSDFILELKKHNFLEPAG
ncbi:MAG: PqqD family peptide modification chaperone [Candidatus Omnitrophota bacterium]